MGLFGTERDLDSRFSTRGERRKSHHELLPGKIALPFVTALAVALLVMDKCNQGEKAHGSENANAAATSAPAPQPPTETRTLPLTPEQISASHQTPKTPD